MNGLKNGVVVIATTTMRAAFATRIEEEAQQGTLAQATLMPGQSLPLSIVFAIPANAMPGRYEGSVVVRVR